MFARRSTSSSVKLGLVGAGMIAYVHGAAAKAQSIPVAAVASRTMGSARELAGQVDATPVRLDAIVDRCSHLVICTPPSSHVELAQQFIPHGRSLLIEKPLADSLSSLDALHATLTEHQGISRVHCAENLLVSPAWKAATAHRGTLGWPTHLSARIMQPPPTWGHFLEPLTSGGVTFDLGYHPISLILDLLGRQPGAVSAEMTSSRDDGADDEATVLLHFDATEQNPSLTVELLISWTSPDTEWGLQAASPTGVIRVELLPNYLVEVNGAPVALDPAPKGIDPSLWSFGYVQQLSSWISNPSECQSLEEATAVTEVIMAAYLSAAEGGKRVTVPTNGDRSLTPQQILAAR